MFFFIFAILSGAAQADDKILVTATRGQASAAELPFSISSIHGERWSAAGGTAEAALSTVPGLAFTNSGGPGQTRSLLIRGSNGEHTLVLIDGIPVNDPLSPSRAFDFGQVPLDDIDHIEVIKGPQSVLYGSDAMGGVVQIFTNRSQKARASVEAGSYRTLKARAAAMGFHAGYSESRGFSSADAREGNTEADGYRQWNVGGNKDFSLNDRFLMRLQAQYQDSKTDTDANGGLRGDKLNTFARHYQFLLREENIVLLPHDSELNVAGSYSAHNREDNTNGGDYYKSELWKVEAVARRPNLVGPHSLTVGGEFGDEAGRSSQTLGGRKDFRSAGLFLQDQFRYGAFHATLGGRVDIYNERENAETYRAGLGYWLYREQLRVKGSIGTGFKNPSLYQTYSAFGSTTLKPERSVGGDFGLEYLGDGWSTELMAFQNDYKDLMDFNTITNKFFNQKRARTQGVEWNLEKNFGHFRGANAYTYLTAWDRDTGRDLLRRPRHSDTLSVGYLRKGVIGANANLRFVGEREDTHPVLNTRQSMPAFFTLGFDFFHEIGEGLRFTGRGENLLDRHYQETSGFGVPALSGYAGIEADL